MGTDCLNAALEYAALGWLVFPAPPGKKKSYKSAEHSGGMRWGATRDADQIKKDWKKWPNANIGIVTGAASGIWVIEADTLEGHGVDGISELHKLIAAQGGEWPNTLIAISPTGSKHHYFQHPGGDVKIVCRTLAPGVDCKGDGGMVIGPPSVVPGLGAYRWCDE
jgi:putative DNA primase/helicase